MSKDDNQENEALETSNGVTAPLVFIPGERFFVVRKTLPEGINRDEVLGYVELALEEESPFPMNQQMWGYVCEKDMAGVLIYSMYTENLSLEEHELYEKADYVYPSFLPAILRKFANEEVFYYKIDGHFNRILLTNGKVEDIESAQNPEVYGEYLGSKYLSDGTVEFRSRVGGSEEKVRLDPLQGTRWEADVRERAKVEDDRKNWGQSRILWRLLMICVCMGFIFGLCEAGKFMTYKYIASQKRLVESRIEHVSQIESEDGLASKIQELNTDYYSPLKLLDLLNQTRPDQVYFTLAKLGNKNAAEIEGIGANVEVVNTYETDLKKSGLTDRVDIGEITSRAGKVSFKMMVEFKVEHVETAPAQPPLEEEKV